MLFAYQRRALAWMAWREEKGPGGTVPRDGLRVSARQGTGGGAASSDVAGPSDNTVVGSPEVPAAEEGAEANPGTPAVQLHWCWRPVVLPSGLHVYYNPYSGMRLVTPPGWGGGINTAGVGSPRGLLSACSSVCVCSGPVPLLFGRLAFL